VNSILSSVQYVRRTSLTNSLPLWVSIPNRKRHGPSKPFARFDHEAALANDQGHALRPAVGEDERVRDAPGSGLAAVRDEILLEEPRDGVLPIGKRADRNTQPNTAGSRPSASLPPRGCRPRLTGALGRASTRLRSVPES